MLIHIYLRHGYGEYCTFEQRVTYILICNLKSHICVKDLQLFLAFFYWEYDGSDFPLNDQLWSCTSRPVYLVLSMYFYLQLNFSMMLTTLQFIFCVCPFGHPFNLFLPFPFLQSFILFCFCFCNFILATSCRRRNKINYIGSLRFSSSFLPLIFI